MAKTGATLIVPDINSMPSKEYAETPTVGPLEDQPLRILALDTQGICSQLFSKQLCTHLNFGSVTHPYILAATMGRDRIHNKLECDDATRKLWDERAAQAPPKIANMTYNIATEKFLREADRLESKGRTLFVKEYSAFIMKHDIMTLAIRSHETIVSKLMNPTVLPDELLQIITPMIFIRHPAIVIPSWLRAAGSDMKLGAHTVDDEDFTVWTSLRWSRIIFDYLRHISHEQQNSGLGRSASVRSANGSPYGPSIVATKPYVIDSADVLNNTSATLDMISTLLGIKASGDTQTPASKKYFERAYEVLKKGLSSNVMKTFQNNTKFQPDQSEPIPSQPDEYTISIDVEMPKWRAEFGDSVANALRRKVYEELPHYEYLRKFKLPIRPASSRKSFNTQRPGLDTSENTTGIGRIRSAVNLRDQYDENQFGSPMRIIQSTIDVRRFSDMAGQATPSPVEDGDGEGFFMKSIGGRCKG